MCEHRARHICVSGTEGNTTEPKSVLVPLPVAVMLYGPRKAEKQASYCTGAEPEPPLSASSQGSFQVPMLEMQTKGDGWVGRQCDGPEHVQ